MLTPVQPYGKTVTNIESMVWGVVDLLRGDFKPAEYGRIIIPLLMARRMDLVLQETLDQVIFEINNHSLSNGLTNIGDLEFLRKITNCGYYRINNLSLIKMSHYTGDKVKTYNMFKEYIGGFSDSIVDIFDGFCLLDLVKRLIDANIFQSVLSVFVSLNVHPDAFSNAEMGDLFEVLIRRFSEASNETVGEHFTPRDAVDLVISLVTAGNDPALSDQASSQRNLYDPTAGTGGFLSAAADRFSRLAPNVRVKLFGQELNPESYAICKADMLSRGDYVSRIALGNTLSEDKFLEDKFHYMISNPPYGVDWKKVEKSVVAEHELGSVGRFAPGLPRTSDGQLLFLMHLISKFPEVDVHGFGGRIAIVMNSAPMMSGGASSGESEIRRYILENDLLESIIELPREMFFNTGISTYIWVLTNCKSANRCDMVALVDASNFARSLAKSLGSKRYYISDEDRVAIMAAYVAGGDWDIAKMPSGEHVPFPVNIDAPADYVSVSPLVRMVHKDQFMYREVVVERPKRDELGNVVTHGRGRKSGAPVPDVSLRSHQKLPYNQQATAFLTDEVLTFVPDAFLDTSKERVGAEIQWGKFFPTDFHVRALSEIDDEIAMLRQLMLHNGV